MPFITEEIWSMVFADSSDKKMLIIEKWPKKFNRFNFIFCPSRRIHPLFAVALVLA